MRSSWRAASVGQHRHFVNLLSGLGINSGTAAFIRIFSGAVLLIPVMMLRGGLPLMRIDRKGLLICTILGVFSQALFNFSYITCR